MDKQGRSKDGLDKNNRHNSRPNENNRTSNVGNKTQKALVDNFKTSERMKERSQKDHSKNFSKR